ncbi:MAG: uracil-DNA glycosylase [Nitrosarchaeum sp.]|nr:uracil-DNA glycosylase [Nitrosarchaeum sp.]
MDKQAALEAIKTRIQTELSCPLKDAATHLVFGKGNCEAELMLIGEAPGAREDLEGIPFVGAAGKELDKLLHSIGLSLNDAYIANILKYRPPGNRDPQPDEIRRHTPFLIEQIRIIAPRVIATLGNFSTRFLLAGCKVDAMHTIKGITTLHGKPQDLILSDLHLTIIPLYHPAAMLYNPHCAQSSHTTSSASANT